MEKTIILPSENCLSDAQLLRYLKDECSLQEQRGIDKHIDKCAFCSDAVQGAINLPIIEFENKMNRENILQAITKKTLWLAKPSAKVWIGLTTAASIAAIFFVSNNYWNAGSKIVAPTTVVSTTNSENTDNQSPMASADAIPVVENAKAKTQEATTLTTTGSVSSTITTGATTTITGYDQANAGGTYNVDVKKLEDVATPSAPAMENVGGSTMERAKDIPPVVVIAEKKSKADVYPSAQNNTQMSQNSNGYNYSDNDNVNDNDDSNSKSYNIGLQMYYAKKYKEAIVTLEKFQNERGTKAEKQKASWFLANAYLSVGNTPRAKQLLENIANGGGTYSEQAKKALENNQ